MKVAADAVDVMLCPRQSRQACTSLKVCVGCLERAVILHAPKAPQFCLSTLLGMARIMHFVLFSVFIWARVASRKLSAMT